MDFEMILSSDFRTIRKGSHDVAEIEFPLTSSRGFCIRSAEGIALHASCNLLDAFNLVAPRTIFTVAGEDKHESGNFRFNLTTYGRNEVVIYWESDRYYIEFDRSCNILQIGEDGEFTQVGYWERDGHSNNFYLSEKIPESLSYVIIGVCGLFDQTQG